MPQPVDPNRQALIDALPTAGRVSYDELRTKLLSSGQIKPLARFHDLRREGLIKTEIEKGADGEAVMFVSRA